MNKDKQIEEMAKIVLQEPHIGGLYGFGERIASRLYDADYRKAPEVARAIFEEIEEGIKAAISSLQFENNPIHRKVRHETYSSLMRFIKTIEKKHTEGEV